MLAYTGELQKDKMILFITNIVNLRGAVTKTLGGALITFILMLHVDLKK